MTRKPRHHPTRYGEYKKRVNISLTETAIGLLDVVAEQFHLNRSEFIEQIARGDLVVSHDRDKLGERLAS